jgi:hypothetical protein
VSQVTGYVARAFRAVPVIIKLETDAVKVNATPAPSCRVFGRTSLQTMSIRDSEGSVMHTAFRGRGDRGFAYMRMDISAEADTNLKVERVISIVVTGCIYLCRCQSGPPY